MGSTIFQFCFNIVPIGFRKLLKPVRKCLFRDNVQLLMYLDDWLINDDSIEDYNCLVNCTLAISQLMGFLLNLRKSYLYPSLNLTWLGLHWNTHERLVADAGGRSFPPSP